MELEILDISLRDISMNIWTTHMHYSPKHIATTSPYIVVALDDGADSQYSSDY